MRILLLSIFLLFQLYGSSQDQLSVHRIMHEIAPELGELPENPEWSLDGSELYFDWKSDEPGIKKIHSYHLKSKEISFLKSIWV